MCSCNNTTAFNTTFNMLNMTTENVTVVSEIFETTEAEAEDITWDDATWILTSAFIIFTMQSGFGLLEAGSVSAKNEVNIMVKNAVDVIFGGLTYWAFGYGMSFGDDTGSNGFIGIGSWAVDAEPKDMGVTFSTFIFQLSFATTATTIDIAGSGGVHLVGGVAGLVATLMLGARTGRYDGEFESNPGNPTNCLVGMFMLWWGWLGFNCGSTFGISGGKWKLAAKSAVTTINASMGGGLVGIIFSRTFNNKLIKVADLVNALLGGLVAITAGCAVVRPWESIIIGATGGIVSILGTLLFDHMQIDDPVGAISVHGLAGIWGMLMVGLFVEQDPLQGLNNGQVGLFKGGGFYLLGVQFLACVAITFWSALISFLQLYIIDKMVGLRLTEYEEIMGCDIIEHGINQGQMPELPAHIELSPQITISAPQTPTKVNNNGVSPGQEFPHLPTRLRTRRSSFGFRASLDNAPHDLMKSAKQDNKLNSMSISTISSVHENPTSF